MLRLCLLSLPFAGALQAEVHGGAPGLARAHPAPAIRVWDECSAPTTVQTLLDAGTQRDHGFTSIFDRGQSATGVGGRSSKLSHRTPG